MAHLSSPHAAKYFLQPWSLTMPSHTNIKYHRATPADFNAWLPIITNPSNNKHMEDMKNMTWSPSAITEWKTQNLSSYNTSLVQLNHLTILISLNSKVIGYGDLFLLENGSFNIGVVIDSSQQRKGIGRLSVGVFIQLALEIGKSDVVEAGTMKANEGFRGLMRSLKVEEVEKLVVVEGRGVLAELSYFIKRDAWREVELDIVWGEGSLVRVGDEG